ncbi:MAG: nucleotide sugar dehydrogenase, partial [Candidatus Cloacimonetes bacterium]|nr:nucleotide sugar dehydrogenase [Candidatus Cloacimonadota bacterium]
MQNFSLTPDGTEYHLPNEEQTKIERKEILRITEEQRKLGRKIVTVQGMGFVGCVMAIVIADAVDENGEPIYYVHGHQRPSKRSFWKVPVINTGIPPVNSSDGEVEELFERCVNQKKNFRAIWHDVA